MSEGKERHLRGKQTQEIKLHLDTSVKEGNATPAVHLFMNQHYRLKKKKKKRVNNVIILSLPIIVKEWIMVRYKYHAEDQPIPSFALF